VGEFDRAQETLGRPGRPHPAKHSFTYAGLLHCAACGGVLTGEEHVKKSGRRYVYYRCSQGRDGGRCRQPAAPEPLLDAQVSELLARLTIPERILRWLLDRVDKASEHEEQSRAAITAN